MIVISSLISGDVKKNNKKLSKQANFKALSFYLARLCFFIVGLEGKPLSHNFYKPVAAHELI